MQSTGDLLVHRSLCEPSEDFNAKNISSIEQELFDKWGAARTTGHTDVEEAFGFRWKFEIRCNAYFKGLDSMNSNTMESLLNCSISTTWMRFFVNRKLFQETVTSLDDDVIYLDKITIYFNQNFSPIDRIDKEDSQFCSIDKMIYYRDSVYAIIVLIPSPLTSQKKNKFQNKEFLNEDNRFEYNIY
ncbi:Protein of unknown function [Cotesia congregata]|uniref:Uncharacterized protein n=1 Tax=Cotesia congregata TaxID=51543 RepID=A0A8J2HFB8_COTCN|nr:Protein of unknown function [Cotesia congregata]